jgi:hypothetical protein
MTKRSTLALILVVSAGLAQAQEASLGQVARQNRTEQQARREAIMELVQEVTPRGTFEAMMNQMMQSATRELEAQSQRQNATLPPDFGSRMRRVMNAVVSYDEMMQWTAEIYSKRFTVDEIHQLRDFYRTPLGQKVVRQMPEMMSDVMVKVTNTITTRMPDAMKKEGLIPSASTVQN